MEGNLANMDLDSLKGKVVAIPQIDKTLTKEGFGADAKAVGDKLKEIEEKSPSAGDMEYSNENSNLASDNVQDAIDEIANDYFSKQGGTINGQLQVQSYDNGHASIIKNHSASADYGTMLSDTAKGGASSKISVCAALGLLTYTDPQGNINDIHHEGNKPFGEYVGNGSTASRTIATKGIGRLIIVYCSTHFSFVTPKGALAVNLSTGTASWIDGVKAFYLNGNLTIATNNDAFNKSNETYYYQVL